MNPTTLRTVAEKLQVASIGSRELDAECARALGWKDIQSIDIFNEIGVHPKRDFPQSLPYWTTSLDASRALAEELLPEWWIKSRTPMYAGDNMPSYAEISSLNNGCPVSAHAQTEPLACMAAILLAVAAKIEGEAK